MVKRLKEGGWEQEGAASDKAAGARDLPNVTYRQFLALLWGIKGPKVSRRSLGRRLLDIIVARYMCVTRDVHGDESDQTVTSTAVYPVLGCAMLLLCGCPLDKQTSPHMCTHIAPRKLLHFR